jgi:fused signal recognition particle receptor
VQLLLFLNIFIKIILLLLLSLTYLARLKNEGNFSVLLGACDTFRAAAIEQLGEWALRANVSIEKPLRKFIFCCEKNLI